MRLFRSARQLMFGALSQGLWKLSTISSLPPDLSTFDNFRTKRA
jgi:hypothetical protein